MLQINTKITYTQQMHDSLGETGEHNTVAQLFTITLSQKSSVPPFWMQRVLTRQALGVGVAPFQDFALLLSLLAPSEAAKTLHELQHALAGRQLLLMPGLGEKKSSTRGKARCCLHQKPRCEKINLQKDCVAAKKVQLASSSALRCLAVVFVERCPAVGCRPLLARRFQP